MPGEDSEPLLSTDAEEEEEEEESSSEEESEEEEDEEKLKEEEEEEEDEEEEEEESEEERQQPQGDEKEKVSRKHESSRKRKKHRNDEDEPDERPSKQRKSKSRVVSFRLLVPSKMVGKVIGKDGGRIKQLREETGAHIKVTDQKEKERVVLISCKDEADQRQCIAEKALIRVATLILEPNNKEEDGAEVETCLLVPDSQAGSVIGKAGSMIKEIRESSGANIRILTKESLHKCAAVSRTDRLVVVLGELAKVQKALKLIAAKLRESPPRKVVLDVKPPLIPLVMSNLAQKTSIEMNVPNDRIGKVIGKSGTVIKRIRAKTGARVKVNELEDGGAERVIVLKGTSAQVAAAQKLVQACLGAKE